MNFSSNSFSCGHSAHNYNNNILCSFNSQDQLLQDSITKGKQLAQKVNPHDPSGRFRSMSVRESTNMRGMLAELCTKTILTEEIKKREIKNVTITESSPIIDDIEGVTQVDLYLTLGDKKYEIETRSSCVRNGIDFGIKMGYFNIVGWYSTSSKPNEPKKDFYLMYLYGFDAPETQARFNSNVEVCFVGGATKSMLQGSLGSDETMRQTGALYRGINPICAGSDSHQILDEIFR